MSGLDDTGVACTVCGAALAPDQRYCVECGQRRGRSDLPIAAVAYEYEESPAPEARPSRWRLTSNSAFIGVIGLLLLSMGVGVLIGRAGTASASKSPTPPVQVVTIAGGGAAAPAASGAATAPASGAAATPAAGSGTAGSAASGGSSAKATTAKTTSTTSTSTTVVKAETTRPLTGPNRPGYHNGKFTGNFFGP